MHVLWSLVAMADVPALKLCELFQDVAGSSYSKPTVNALFNWTKRLAIVASVERYFYART